MYIDATEYVNSAYVSSSNDSTEETTDEEMFLTILLAQLENQDPLNPMEDAEMVSELTQISSLEQLTEVNESLSGLADNISAMTVNSAVSYIGMDATAEGDTLTLNDGASSTVHYTLADDAESVVAHIYDADGDIYNSVELGSQAAGEYEFNWDGETYTGDTAEDGTYYVAFEAVDAYDDAVSVSAQVSGTIVGITSENGYSQFELSDGRLVDLMSISSVTTPSTSTSTE